MTRLSFDYYGRGMFYPLLRAAFTALMTGKVRVYVDFSKPEDVALFNHAINAKGSAS